MKDKKRSKQKVLVFIDWFWPGYKAGGPISAMINFVHHLQDYYDVYIFTSDRDLNAAEPYTGIQTDTWVSYEKAKVYYCSPAHLGYRQVSNIVKNIKPQYIYLNSLFSKHFTIYPLLLGAAVKRSSKIVLAPRGMLKASALQYKAFKKRFFLLVCKNIGLYKHTFFQATDSTEVKDIKKHFGNNTPVTLVPDFPEYVQPYSGSTEKKAGELKMIFVGRLHPIKQPAYLLELLPGMEGQVLLTIVGDEEDKAYADYCRKIVASFPENIKVHFAGGVPNNSLPALFARHHLFVLPTQGENFGHAIFEALAQGKPVLISDQTPWRALADSHAGWDLPLGYPELFRNTLQQVLQMDQPQYDQWSNGAWQFAKHFTEQSDLTTSYKNLFN